MAIIAHHAVWLADRSTGIRVVVSMSRTFSLPNR
jgi:hypothetical protein